MAGNDSRASPAGKPGDGPAGVGGGAGRAGRPRTPALGRRDWIESGTGPRQAVFDASRRERRDAAPPRDGRDQGLAGGPAAGGALDQALPNSGFRFSTNAAMPSFWPGVPNDAWNRRRSKRMPSESVVS